MARKEWRISGIGIKRAIQKAVRGRKNAAFICDYTSTGQVLRVGYVLVDPGVAETPQDAEITWLDPSEVELRAADVGESTPQAELDVRFREPQKGHAFTLIQQSIGDGVEIRLRALLREHKAGNAGFVVQVEVRDSPSSEWRPAVRYDCAHGEAHRDMLPKDGSRSKVSLGNREGEAAIRQAFAELEIHVGEWLRDLGFLASADLGRDPVIQKRVLEAEEMLLRLWKDPTSLSQEESRFIQFR